MTVAALPISGTAASASPAVISQNVAQPSRRDASEVPSASTATNGTKPQMKNVVHTRTLRTPCRLRP
jgi:hypothetical protein